jgi:hypothetical protein
VTETTGAAKEAFDPDVFWLDPNSVPTFGDYFRLWFTYYQSQYASSNRLVGPDRISPLYQIIVAINDDTLYASTFVDLRAQPVILTIPVTNAAYSVLTLDSCGNMFESGIQPQTPGTYALTGPGWTGTLPAGVTPIAMPLNFTSLIFRADKFSPNGEDEISDAEQFRASLKTQPLCAYLNQTCPPGVPAGGTALILPEIAFAVPFKTMADELIAKDAITFLQQLQTAVASSNTPPMSPYEQRVSDRKPASTAQSDARTPHPCAKQFQSLDEEA